VVAWDGDGVRDIAIVDGTGAARSSYFSDLSYFDSIMTLWVNNLVS
jgi:hypothetical protein